MSVERISLAYQVYPTAFWRQGTLVAGASPGTLWSLSAGEPPLPKASGTSLRDGIRHHLEKATRRTLAPDTERLANLIANVRTLNSVLAGGPRLPHPVALGGVSEAGLRALAMQLRDLEAMGSDPIFEPSPELTACGAAGVGAYVPAAERLLNTQCRVAGLYYQDILEAAQTLAGQAARLRTEISPSCQPQLRPSLREARAALKALLDSLMRDLLALQRVHSALANSVSTLRASKAAPLPAILTDLETPLAAANPADRASIAAFYTQAFNQTHALRELFVGALLPALRLAQKRCAEALGENIGQPRKLQPTPALAALSPPAARAATPPLRCGSPPGVTVANWGVV